MWPLNGQTLAASLVAFAGFLTLPHRPDVATTPPPTSQGFHHSLRHNRRAWTCKFASRVPAKSPPMRAWQDMGSLLQLVHSEFGPGVIKRPSPSNGTGATVATAAHLIAGQVLEW